MDIDASDAALSASMGRRIRNDAVALICLYGKQCTFLLLFALKLAINNFSDSV